MSDHAIVGCKTKANGEYNDVTEQVKGSHSKKTFKLREPEVTRRNEFPGSVCPLSRNPVFV